MVRQISRLDVGSEVPHRRDLCQSVLPRGNDVLHQPRVTGPRPAQHCSQQLLKQTLARRGHRFCRYADDCNIYVRSRRAGERVMASVSRFLTNKLRLKVNEAKSAVARPEERRFLGFSISNDGSERRIAPKALDTFKERIRDMTRRTRGFGLQQLIKELTPYIVGWRGYFGFCRPREVLTNLEAARAPPCRPPR